MSNSKVFFFFYEGWLDVSPTVLGISRLLSMQNSDVFILTRRNSKEQLTYRFSEKNIEVFYLDHLIIDLKVREFISKIRLRTFLNVLDLFFFFLQCLPILFQKSVSASPLNLLAIGVDTNGSICAWIFALIAKVKLVYVSLELTLKEKYTNFDKIRLYLEKFSFRKASYVIIQDKDRFKELCNVHSFEHQFPVYVSNSSFHPEDKKSEVIQAPNFFRKKFGAHISDFSHLILHAGMICDDVLSKCLARTFKELKSNKYALIFHERFHRSLEEPYIQEIRDLNSRNTFLSLDPLPFLEIGQVFRAADIGLVIYSPKNKNFIKIGKASGKLSQYLRFGKPVIMNNFPSLEELNFKYQIGVTIKNPEDAWEMQKAIDEILDNYSFYSQNAKVCYAREFDMEKQLNPLLQLIV